MPVLLLYTSLTSIFSLHCIILIPEEWTEKTITNEDIIRTRNKFWRRSIFLVPDNSEGLGSHSPVQTILPIEVCMDKTKNWSVTLLLEIMDSLLSLKMWQLYPCLVVKLFPVRAPRLHHKEPKTTKIQNKKAAITLETRQSLEDSPSEKPLGATWTECFEPVQHKLLSKPVLWNEKAHSLGRCMTLFIQAHSWILTPTYFCDFSCFFYLCNAMLVSKFVIRFKALPVIQVLTSLTAEQRDLKFVFVIVVFPGKTIMWKHPALSLTSTIFYFNFKKFNNLNKLSESIFLSFLLAVHLWLPNYSLICISDSMSNKTLKCHFMVASRNDSIYYATLYPCRYPDSKIKYLATPNAVPYFS